MTPEQHKAFPVGRDFLEFVQTETDKASQRVDLFSQESGKCLPATLDGLGMVLSLLYRLACCAWGCRGGDHQMEWLTGRVVNHALSAHRLIRAGSYDEALVLIRGIGEIANLLWLFHVDPTALEWWKVAERHERLNQFSPGKVRNLLKRAISIGPPIDDNRYRALCEIGTHPRPAFAPGHYSGTGRPVLGVLIQPAGVYMTMTELGFAVAMAATPLSRLLVADDEIRNALRTEAVALVRALGTFTILNYEELLENVREKRTPTAGDDDTEKEV
jgi:hypothetical protein